MFKMIIEVNNRILHLMTIIKAIKEKLKHIFMLQRPVMDHDDFQYTNISIDCDFFRNMT